MMNEASVRLELSDVADLLRQEACISGYRGGPSKPFEHGAMAEGRREADGRYSLIGKRAPLAFDLEIEQAPMRVKSS